MPSKGSCRAFKQYMRLVCRSWWAYIGLPMGVLRLIEKWEGIAIPIPHWVMLGVGAFGICAAQWKAYKSLFNLKAERVEALAALLTEGQDIRRSLDTSRLGDPAWQKEWQAWRTKVQDFLRDRVGPAGLTVFADSVGLPKTAPVSRFANEHPWMDRDLQNLREIMEQVDTYTTK